MWWLLCLLLLVYSHIFMKHCMDLCLSTVVHFLCWKYCFKCNNMHTIFLCLMFLFLWLDCMNVLGLLMCMYFCCKKSLSLSMDIYHPFNYLYTYTPSFHVLKYYNCFCFKLWCFSTKSSYPLLLQLWVVCFVLWTLHKSLIICKVWISLVLCSNIFQVSLHPHDVWPKMFSRSFTTMYFTKLHHLPTSISYRSIAFYFVQNMV
jgi:hypothetical protein